MTLLSMNEITTFRWSFEEDVENYLQAGYRAIGVWRHKLTDCEETRAIDLLDCSGLRVSNLSWAGGFTGGDGCSLAESIDDAAEALRLAAGLQAGCLVIYPGGRNNHIYRHASRLLRLALDELLPLAEEMEVPLAIEPMHPACATAWTFLTDLKDVHLLLEEYSNPHLKLAYDTYHFPFDSRHRKFLTELAPHIGIVHLCDRRVPPNAELERCQLGCGRIPLFDIVSTLQEAGYTGAFDVKLIGQEIESCDYWRLLDHSQQAFAELVNPIATRSFA